MVDKPVTVVIALSRMDCLTWTIDCFSLSEAGHSITGHTTILSVGLAPYLVLENMVPIILFSVGLLVVISMLWEP